LPVGLRPLTNRTRVDPRVALERAKRRWRAPTWAEQASCAGQTDLFFGHPTETDRERAERERQALAVCAVCPVVAPCRDHARRFREAGIWGGENEAQRRAASKLEKLEKLGQQHAGGHGDVSTTFGRGLDGDAGVAG
jgi:WhiB family transcriptional regulator, redox-sensing transcriptional regulator